MAALPRAFRGISRGLSGHPTACLNPVALLNVDTRGLSNSNIAGLVHHIGLLRPVTWQHNRPGWNVPGRCYAALLSREEKEKLLAGVSRDHIDVAARVLDQAATAAGQWSVVHTDFLTPPAQQDVLMVLRRLADVGAMVSGGYAQAERCRLSVGHPEALGLATPEREGAGYPGAVAALRVSGNFAFDSAAHGDFLGAVLGTGITREKVGDILVQEGHGAQVLVAPEMVDFLLMALRQVRNVSVTVEPIPLATLEVREPKVDVLKSVEASLRVDAVASAGFRMSRTKLADLIAGGNLRVNWKEVTKGGAVLKTGDVVSVRGKGRLEIGEISLTKKGRYSVELTRYV